MSDRQVAIGIWEGRDITLRQSSRRPGDPPGFPWWPDMRTGFRVEPRLGVRESASVRGAVGARSAVHTRFGCRRISHWRFTRCGLGGLGVAAALCSRNACRRRACAPAAGTTCGSRRSGVGVRESEINATSDTVTPIGWYGEWCAAASPKLRRSLWSAWPGRSSAS